jgi:Uma2 family endonuclease
MSIVDLPQTLPYQPVRMSVDRYHQLIRAGAFDEHDSVELLDGVVTEKMAKNPSHCLSTRRCDLALSNVVSTAWHVRNQEPITLQNSEPEPDVAVIRGLLSDYGDRHPQVGDVALVVEVAETSLVTDRYKAQIYAQAGIPVYWIVNLSERVIEVMEEPDSSASPAVYKRFKQYLPGDLVPVVIDGVVITRLQSSELLLS